MFYLIGQNWKKARKQCGGSPPEAQGGIYFQFRLHTNSAGLYVLWHYDKISCRKTVLNEMENFIFD
jgi:hypothetical protein